VTRAGGETRTRTLGAPAKHGARSETFAGTHTGMEPNSARRERFERHVMIGVGAHPCGLQTARVIQAVREFAN
jgi:hypothetical protein